MQNDETGWKRLRYDPWEQGLYVGHSPLGLGLVLYAFEFFQPGGWVKYAL